jgi:1-acyl-sn-glycerol-3-phosphate acyltransferase
MLSIRIMPHPSILPFRTALAVVRLSLTVVGYSLLGLTFRLIEHDHRLFFEYGYRFAQSLLRIAGVKLEVEGYELLNEKENYVFIANHVSLFDIPAVWAAIGQVIRIRIIYKRDLEAVPVFGWVLKASPFIAIQRDKARDSMAGIATATEAIRAGSSVLIFAEGTRSRSGTLLPFKRGAFMLAARAHKPIVPVAIIGTHHVLPADTINVQPGTIRVVIHPPIPNPAPSLTIQPKTISSANENDDRQHEKHLMHTVYSTILATLPPEMKP